MQIKITNEISGQRLDVYLTEYLQGSRSNISKHIKEGDVKVNGEKVKTGYTLKEDDLIEYTIWNETTDILPENIPLDIYYEDEYIIVVNKKSGMVVHPGNGNTTGTLVNALMYHTENLSDINGTDRPGIVHRIDKDTSGLLLISKNNEVHKILSEDFKNKKVKRKYIALVNGVIKTDKGKIDAPIGRSETDRKKMCVTEKNSKNAVTNFTVLERYKTSTLIECILETGRTHQIRVHMSYIKHPVINDPVYNTKTINSYGQMLHAAYLGFTHPITNEFLEFNSPLEPEFLEILDTFKNS